MIKFTKSENVIEKRSFLKLIFVCFLMPIVIMLISVFLVSNSYKNLFQNEIKNNYISNLSALSDTVNSSLLELQNTSILLSSDSNLYDIFYSENKLDTLDGDKINGMINTLTKFKSTKNLIDSIYILHKQSNEVLATNGTCDADVFYAKTAIYDKYNAEFWRNLKVKNNFFQILSPSSMQSISQESTITHDVIPFVTSNIESFKSPNLFVINLSEDNLTELLEKYKLMPSSKLCIIDHKGTSFSSTDKQFTSKILSDKNFLAKALKSNNNIFQYKINGKNTLVVSFSSDSAKFNDFVYVAFIPFNDFYQKLTNIKTLVFIITIIALIFSLVVSYAMSKKIYSPIGNLVSILSNSDPNYPKSSVGEIDFLNTQIKKILVNEDILKKDLSIVMPLASEHYLTKILTNNDSFIDKDVENFINNAHINFKYPGFCVSIIELNFTEKYYSIYSYDDHLLVKKGITRLLHEIALSDYATYVLNPTKNKLCVLINLPENENLGIIAENIRNVIELFNYDKDLLSISAGVGRICSNYIGMNLSYNEALKALALISPLSDENIRIYSECNNKSSYQYSINDENKLYNYLLGCYKEDTLSFLNGIIEKNFQNNPTETAIKKLYLSIYNTISRVLQEKDIDPSSLMRNDYIDIQSDINLYTNHDINNYLFKLVNKLLSSNNKINSKIDINEITDYIKAHYNEDIYLEKLGQIFNTSEKYLSRLFKESLGIGFHEYLASIRIAKSKNLLLETNLSVIKVGEMIGFTNHSTFFRIFKKFEGINPTQYRENNKKK